VSIHGVRGWARLGAVGRGWARLGAVGRGWGFCYFACQ